MKHRKLIDGLGLLALAALFLWFPLKLKQPGIAHHKMLSASKMSKNDIFNHASVLVLKHNGYGAMGVIVNRPRGKKARDGGPVRTDKSITLYDIAHAPPDAIFLPDLSLAYKMAADAQNGIVYEGRAEWAPGQLDREIRHGAWKVTAADNRMIFGKP